MLSKYQRRLLQLPNGGFYDEYGESDKKRIDELVESGYLNRIDFIVTVTEKGMSELEAFRREEIHYWIPVVLSVVAILISVAALIVSLGK